MWRYRIMDKTTPTLALETSHNYSTPPTRPQPPQTPIAYITTTNCASADRIWTIKCQFRVRRSGMNISTQPPPSVRQLLLR